MNESARQMMMLSHRLADQFNHEFVGAIHLCASLLSDSLPFRLEFLAHQIDPGPIQSVADRQLNRTQLRTNETISILEIAIAESRTRKHDFVDCAHLAVAMLEDPQRTIHSVLYEARMSAGLIDYFAEKRLAQFNPNLVRSPGSSGSCPHEKMLLDEVSQIRQLQQNAAMAGQFQLATAYLRRGEMLCNQLELNQNSPDKLDEA